MKQEYIEERQLLIEKIESEFTALIAGGGGNDDCRDERDECRSECRLEFPNSETEKAECYASCDDHYDDCKADNELTEDD